MPLKEGRCPNCGSILQLNTAAEKGHCLFCDAVFENTQAFDIADNPGEYTFPNLPQPKYEGPNLDPDLSARGSGMSASSANKPKKKPRPAPPPVYIPKEPVKLPDIRLPGKIKLRILLISLAVILVIAAVAIPLIMKRDEVRKGLLDSLDELAPFAIQVEKDAAIWHTANNYLMVSTADAVTQDDAIAFFKAFCEKRAALLGADAQNFQAVYSPVKVKLVSPDGGYLIAQPDSQADLDSGKAVTVLP